MDNTPDLIGRRTYKAGNAVINIPTVGMIRGENDNDERDFWQEAGLFMKTPYDMISELDDFGLDFEKISDFKLFLMLFIGTKATGIRKSILFKDYDLFMLEPNTDYTALVDKQGREIITEQTYGEISDVICSMLCHKKTQKRKFGNKLARDKAIEFDREKKKRAARNRLDRNNTMLGSVILRLVCSGKFPYDFDTVNSVTVYELMWAVRQIDKEIGVNDLMQSRLVGNDLSKLPADTLSRYVI